MLLRIPALLTPEEVATCRQTLEQAPWEDGRATAGQLAAQVKHNLQLPLASEAAKTLGEFLLNKLAHNPLYLSAALPLKVLLHTLQIPALQSALFSGGEPVSGQK